MSSGREIAANQNGYTDEPLQLIEFVRNDDEGNTAIKLLDETFELITKRAGNRPLSTICVCGPSRQGKSFLLGYMIRCLEAMEKEETDWMDWDNRAKALKGFRFRNGTAPETQGIWVWSRPFIIKNDEDVEIAVILIDTQGTCDAFTTNKDMSAIVGLSLLTSSVMIFNFFTNLQEDILTAMNTYTQYGQLALDNSSDTPFQKLIFLIRDWNMPDDYSFGSKGGKTFIQDKLKISPELSPEAKQVRETIRECFQELDCFLMPAIGEKALSTGFTGSIAEINPTFAKKMEEFITNLMSSDSLLVKEILGNVVTAKELKSYLNNYLEIFNSSELPSAKTMWEATSDVHNSHIVKKAIQKFNDLIKKSMRGKPYLLPEDMEKALKTADKQASDIFKKARKFGTRVKIAEYEEQLDETLSQTKTDFKKQNEEKRNNYISEVLDECTAQFRKFLEGATPLDENDLSTFYEDSEIKRVATQIEDKVITELKKNLEGETREALKTQVESLGANLDSIVASHINKNKAIRAEAEKAIRKILEALSSEFETNLGELLDAHKYVEYENLNENVKKITDCTIDTWGKTKTPGNVDFYQVHETKLKDELRRISSKFQNEHTVHLQECQLKGDDFIQRISTGYEQKMTALVKDTDSLEKLQEIHKKFQHEILENFVKTGNPYPPATPLHTKLVKKLEARLQNIFESGQKEALQLQQRCEESYRQAVEKAKNNFDEKMQAIFSSSEFLPEKDLEAEYKRLFYESVKIFENSEKSGQFDFSQKFKSKLQELVEKEYQKIKKDNKQRFQLFYSTVVNYVQDAQKKYESIMKTGMNSAKTVEQLERLHAQASQEARNFLKEKFPSQKCSGVLEEYEEKLDKDIAGTFEELKYLFEMHQEKKDVKKERVLLDCIKYYHDEMQTHCQNATFIQPEQMDEFNEQSVSFALNASIEKFKLTSDQVLELEEEMRKLYENYLVQNDMKMNYGAGVIPAIGIDLGTTYCCVAVYINGEVIIIPNQKQGNAETTASYVMYDLDDSVASFGNDAKQIAFKNPENTIYDAKRILGRKINDEKLQADMKFWPFKVEEDDGVPKININGKLYHPEKISAQLLAEFRTMTEKHLGLPSDSITKAVITVPAYFNDGQRQATIDAGEIAGLEVLTILNEPTAAAIAYSLKRLDHSPRKVLVFDLGGGTFDVAILDVNSQKISALAVNGDTHLGGEDFDKNMMDYCASMFQKENGIDPLVGKDSSNKKEKDEAQRRISRLRGRCEAEKRNLASSRTATVSIDAFYVHPDGRGALDLVVEVTRQKFEELNEPLFRRTIDIVEMALKDAKIGKEEIEDIILVGGSTRIPRVQELLTEFFEGKALNYSIHPDQAVAYGAAVKAAMINGGQAKGTHIVATDVAPFPLGIEVFTGELSVIIPKNTTIPFKTVKRDYKTVRDGQTSVNINVYQGDDEAKAVNNELLGEFLLEGIPPAAQGKELVDVSMEIDAMGILHVEAVCRSTGSSNRITVTANKQRMTEEQKMLLAKSVRAA